MNEEENKEIIRFILDSIEKISLAIIQGDHEVQEMEEMHNEAQRHLNGINREEKK